MTGAHIWYEMDRRPQPPNPYQEYNTCLLLAQLLYLREGNILARITANPTKEEPANDTFRLVRISSEAAMSASRICRHERRLQVILTDDSTTFDCRDCDEPLVQVQGRWVSVQESTKPSPRDLAQGYAARAAANGLPNALIVEAFCCGFEAATASET